ncbi:MAG: GTPase HflX [Oscillospiraceae bacterium]|jgi:GTP-binding protein HflX|nr:GTPase HflX [Oscillospiraceae bacterium]
MISSVLLAVDDGTYDVDSSLDELAELLKTAGGEAVARVTQKRDKPDSHTCFGSGKLEETAEFIKANAVELAVFDNELSSSQTRGAEEILGCRVIDRTMLILDIFAARALSAEGKLQVELAQLRYTLPRLSSASKGLSRQGGGIGARGPGETKLETSKRHVREKILHLERELEALSQKRSQSRQRRRKDGRLTAAIVGYTNAGKSTLLNKLTKAGVLSEDKLFATLDLTSRGLYLPNGATVTVTDTVGLIRRLPHHLVEAFKSTLEEAAFSDVLIHVIDVSDPEWHEKKQTAVDTLASLGCGDIPVLNLYNKADKLAEQPVDIDGVFLSAKSGEGIDEMKRRLADLLGDSF